MVDTVVKDITPEESLVASTFIASVIQNAVVRLSIYSCTVFPNVSNVHFV